MFGFKKRVMIFLALILLASCTFTGLQTKSFDNSGPNVEAQKALCKGDFDHALPSGEKLTDIFNQALEEYTNEHKLDQKISETEKFAELTGQLKEFLSAFQGKGIAPPFNINGLTYEKLRESIPSQNSEVECTAGYFETYLVTGLDNFIDAKKLSQMINVFQLDGYTPYGIQQALLPEKTLEEVEKMYSPEQRTKNFKKLLAKNVPHSVPSSFCEDLSTPDKGEYSCPSSCSMFVADDTTNLPEIDYALLMDFQNFALNAQPELRAATTDTTPVLIYVLDYVSKNFLVDIDFSLCDKYASNDEISDALHKLDEFVYDHFNNILRTKLYEMVNDIFKDFYFVHVQRCGCFGSDAYCPITVKRA